MNTFRGQRPYALAILALVLVSAPMDAQVLFDGNGGDQNPIAVGGLTTVEVHGPPLSNFMLFGGARAASFNTPVGQLGVDIFDSSFRVGIDGLTPGSPTFNLGWTGPTGAAGFSIIAFPNNSAVGAELFGQAAFLDPTNIFGVSLTQRAGAIAIATVPEIEEVSPHSAVPGQPVTIIGTNLGGAANNGQPPLVTLNGVSLQVLSHTGGSVDVLIPPGATSGSIRLTTVGGISAVVEEGWPSWVSVFPGTLIGESAASALTLTGAHTVIGTVATQQEVDTYRIHLNEGDEFFCEVQTWNPATVDIRLHDPQDFYGGGVNPYLRIALPGYPFDHIVADDDAGPGHAAALGIGSGPRFIAPRDGVIEVKVESRHAFTFGPYALNFWTEPAPAGIAPELLLIHPNIAPPGSTVEVVAWGMMPLAFPASIMFSGPGNTTVDVTPYLDENDRLLVQVPAGAESGPVRVRNAMGLTSTIATNVYPQFLMVQRNGVFEGQTTTVSDDDQVLGDVGALFETDIYQVTLNAGDRLHAHCAPFDLPAMRMLEGRTFVVGLLDPYLVIRDPLTGQIYQNDNNAGPGTSAMIGGMLGNPFVAPVTQNYEILVRGFLTISTGPYILDIQID